MEETTCVALGLGALAGIYYMRQQRLSFLPMGPAPSECSARVADVSARAAATAMPAEEEETIWDAELFPSMASDESFQKHFEGARAPGKDAEKKARKVAYELHETAMETTFKNQIGVTRPRIGCAETTVRPKIDPASTGLFGFPEAAQ